MNKDVEITHHKNEKALTEFLLELFRICKTYTLYPAGHPTILSMFVKPFEDISDLLETTEELVFEYRRGEGFLVDGIPVASKLPVIKELVEDLFKRRIRTLIFLRGLKLIELRYLIDVITSEPGTIERSGGGESMLQGKGVRHIWFNEVDYSKILDSQKENGEKAAEVKTLAGKVEGGEGEGIYGFLGDEEGEAETGMPQPQPGPVSRHTEPVSAKEEELLPEDLDKLIKLWNEAEEFSEFERLGKILINRVISAADENDYESAQKIVNAFFSVEDGIGGRDEFFVKFVSNGLDRIASGNGPLALFLNRACTAGSIEDTSINAIVRFGRRVAGRVADRLAVENDSRVRHLLNNLLVRMGKEIIPQLVERLGDARWYMVRNMVRILGEVGEGSGVEHELMSAMSHPDPRVRKETVRSVSMIRGPEALSILRGALGDHDGGVAESAAVSIGLLRDEGSVSILLDLLERKEDHGARNEMIRALGRIGSRRAVPFLARTLAKKVWLGGERDDELKIRCAEALSEIASPEALTALEAGRESSREAVRKACEEGIRRIKHV